MRFKLTVYDSNDSITYESDDANKIIEQIENIKAKEKEREENKEIRRRKNNTRPMTPYERTRAIVYATGNKWAIENFNATH